MSDFLKRLFEIQKDLLFSADLLIPFKKLQKVCRAELQFANATVIVSKCII